MVDAELSSSARYRWILAEDEPDLMPYDQDRWANRLHSVDEPVDALLPVFDALRAANLRAVERGARRPIAPGSASISNAGRRAMS